MNVRNPYRSFGLVLLVAGSIFAPVAYFLIASAGLTAVGISAMMIGFTAVALANARPVISPEAAQLMLRTGMANTAALLEELGLQEKAIYLPSSMLSGPPQALVPLNKTSDLNIVRTKLPGRLIVRYGNAGDAMGLLITTPGSLDFSQLKIALGPTADEIESALSYVLTGLLDLSSSVVISVSGNQVIARIGGARLHFDNIWYYRSLGSPIGSIVATITCEAIGKPVRIIEEKADRGKSTITLEVLQ